MKVLIAGTNGYIGSHVQSLFNASEYEIFSYNRHGVESLSNNSISSKSAQFYNQFDVVINCARPHWSEYTTEEIAHHENILIDQLESFCKDNAVKIHTSGVWLFGKATDTDLRSFSLKPLNVVQSDVDTINKVIKLQWNVVYCPSLVYGGKNCQLRRIINNLDERTLDVAVPSVGYNQYIHVIDIANYYMYLVQNKITNQQNFIAESVGYSPVDFSELMLNNNIIDKTNKMGWTEFESQNGSESTEIEKLNLHLPVDINFRQQYSIKQYIENYPRD